MFRFKQNFKNLKFIDSVLLQQQTHTTFCSYNLRFLSSAFYSTKKISLPEINDEKLRNSIFTNDNKFYRFYGDKAYNYYVVRALKLKLPNATRTEFTAVTNILITRKFLIEIAEACELDKMLSLHVKSSFHLGEMMEAYCSGMLFNGMEKEMKKFASDVVDYYFAKEKVSSNKVVKENIPNKAVNEKQKKSVKMNNKNKNTEKKKKDDRPKKEILLIESGE